MNDYRSHNLLMRLVGMVGVDNRENDRAQLWGRRLEWPLILVAFWILIDWYHRETGIDRTGTLLEFSDWIIWGFFLFELTLMLYIVDRPLRYLRGNWLSLIIVLAGVPLTINALPFITTGALRALRLLLFISILVRVSSHLRSVLARHNLGITLIVALGFMILAAFLISGLDPAFENPVDGFWWAWVTMTTVGYGDLVPTTLEGRIVGMVLILVGIAIFSLLTASFSVFFIEKDEQEMVDREEDNIRRIQLLEARLERIEKHLETAVTTLDRMETLQASARLPLSKKQTTPVPEDDSEETEDPTQLKRR